MLKLLVVFYSFCSFTFAQADVHVISEVMFPEIQGQQNLSFDYQGYRYQVRILAPFVIFRMYEAPNMNHLETQMAGQSPSSLCNILVLFIKKFSRNLCVSK